MMAIYRAYKNPDIKIHLPLCVELKHFKCKRCHSANDKKLSMKKYNNFILFEKKMFLNLFK